jgi:hypothetical protein
MNGTGISTAEGTSSISSALVATATYLNLPDPVYGTGSDSDVTISANTTLTTDKFYNNLTINDNITLNCGGYRVFVKGTLTLGSDAIIGYTTGQSTAVIHSLGGASASQTATAPVAGLGGSAYYQQPLQAIKGWAVSASTTTPTFLRGGAGGASGAGGGVVIIAARYITVSSGTAYFKAPGTSGSGGGGGGVILIVSSASVLNSGVSTDVTGGTSCTSGTVNYMQVA